MSNLRGACFPIVIVALASCSGGAQLAPQVASPNSAVETIPQRTAAVAADTAIRQPLNFKEFSLPSGQTPQSVTMDSSGNAWVLTNTAVDRVTQNGEIQTFPVPNPATTFQGGITFGPDENLWFLGSRTNGPNFPPALVKIFRMTTSGVLATYPYPQRFANGTGLPADITSGADGNLWFVVTTSNPSEPCGAAGAISVYGKFSPLRDVCAATAIALGPGVDAWLTFDGYDFAQSAAFNLSTHTKFRFAQSTEPQGIAAGSDGNLWLTFVGQNAIARMSTTGKFTRFILPTRNALGPAGEAQVARIVNGGDNTLWFLENPANQIGRITTSGQITEYQIPTANSSPSGLAVSPPVGTKLGRVWFTESATDKIGQLTL